MAPGSDGAATPNFIRRPNPSGIVALSSARVSAGGREPCQPRRTPGTTAVFDRG